MSINDDKIKEFFKTKLKESGHSLENDVETKLEKYFTVEREKPYLDKDEGKGRSFDILAYSFFPEVDKITNKKKMALGELFLVIECKNLPDNGWIFFKKNKQDDYLIPEIFTFIKTNRQEEIIDKCIPYDLVPNLCYASGYLEAVLDNKKQDQQSKAKTNFKDSNLYQAILTTIKATRTEIDKAEQLRKSMYRIYNQADKIPFIIIYQPLIVFTGHMYVQLKNEDDIQPIKYVQIKKEYQSSKYNEQLGTIHIVHYSALEEYIDIIHQHFGFGSNYIINHQEELLDLMKNSLVRWEDFKPF